jgi:3-isopropylmalate/(R)-2-methylmalate dehydratase large subunit
VRIELSGSFARGACARDLALKIVGDLGAEGAAYKAVEFAGPSAATLPMDDRIALCNLMVEAGAKNALFGSDQVTFDYLTALNRPIQAEPLQSDADAAYERILTYDLGCVAPAVAAPHAVDNYGTVADYAGKKQAVNQGFIGSCSAGRMGELREAARILRGRQVKPGVRLIVTPASRAVQAEAATEGILATLLDAGAIVMNPNCSVCWGACQGVMGPGETLISTGTRNFKGRAGSKDSSVYLASAATVAASCVAGHIVDPRELMQ